MSTAPSPRKIKLIKAAKAAFTVAGWSVVNQSEDSYDFRVDCGELRFFINCLDETRMLYESSISTIERLERYARVLQVSGNRQMIVVLEWNFLSIDLDRLIDRSIFALALNDISIITSLVSYCDQIPGAVTSRQAYLLERSVEYAIFISGLHYKKRNFAEAIQWGRYAVQHSAGFSRAYPWLFQLLKDAGELDAAAEFGGEMGLFRPDDRHFLLGMEDLARKRGNSDEAASWRHRLTELPTKARTFEDILAKQRAQNTAVLSPKSAAPVSQAPAAERGVSRLFKIFRRS